MSKIRGIGWALLFCLQSPGLAQNAISVSPTTGTSTLDNLRPTRGDQIELEFPSGFRCKVQSGDKPSLTVYGDRGDLSGISGTRVGIALIIPLYPPRENLCDSSAYMQDALSRLEIADKLLQSGTITNEEYKKVAEFVKDSILRSINR